MVPETYFTYLLFGSRRPSTHSSSTHVEYPLVSNRELFLLFFNLDSLFLSVIDFLLELPTFDSSMPYPVFYLTFYLNPSSSSRFCFCRFPHFCVQDSPGLVGRSCLVPGDKRFPTRHSRGTDPKVIRKDTESGYNGPCQGPFWSILSRRFGWSLILLYELSNL